MSRVSYLVKNYHNGRDEVQLTLKALQEREEAMVRMEVNYSSWRGKAECSIALWFGELERVGDSDQVGIYFRPKIDLINECMEALN